MLRTPDAYLASLQDNPRRAPFLTDAARTNINPLPAKRRQGLQSREQMPACGKITVLRGANDDIDIVRPARKMRVNIAFPAGHHHHRRRRRVQKHAGGAGRLQPAAGAPCPQNPARAGVANPCPNASRSCSSTGRAALRCRCPPRSTDGRKNPAPCRYRPAPAPCGPCHGRRN